MKLPDTIEPGQELEVQLAPYGDWELHDGEDGHEGVMQKVDAAAMDALVAAFDREVLVDVDHQSCDGGATEAAAWVTALRRDPESGLMGTFRLTDLGAAAVAEGRYRYVSPVWTLDADGRPRKLISVALTNTPNIPVRPVLNAARSRNARIAVANALHFSPRLPGAQGDASGADAPEGRFSRPEQTQERNPKMEEIKTLLGLPPEATDAEAADAVKALKEKVDALEAEKADAEAEGFANENEDKGVDHDVLKNAYRAAPDVVRAVMNSLRPVRAAADTPQHPAPVCVAKNAKTPILAANRAQAGLAACKTPQERCSYVMNHAAELAAND